MGRLPRIFRRDALAWLALVVGAFWWSWQTPAAGAVEQKSPPKTAAPHHQGDADLMDRQALRETDTDDLDALVWRRVIRVLTTYNRTNFFIVDGPPRGFEYDPLKHYQAYLKTLDDLSGRRIYVDPQTRYAQSPRALGKKFAKRGLKPIEIVDADPNLLTEDILDLVNAGIVDVTVAANRWFLGVERIARQSGLWETVRYVANVNKYYIAYKLSATAYRERAARVRSIKNGGSR